MGVGNISQDTLQAWVIDVGNTWTGFSVGLADKKF